MKVPLKVPMNEAQAGKAAQFRIIERDILAIRKGDWNAKNSLFQTFMPLLTALAEKRSHEPAALNKYIEAGKQGLLTAVKKFKSSTGVERFQIFALDYIEARMDDADKPIGFFARLFSRE